MLRKASLILVLLSSPLFLSNCASREAEVQGSIFVVTKGGDNYKLGLVKVSAIPEQEIISFIEKKKTLIGVETDKLKSELDSIKIELAISQNNYDDAKKNHDSLNSQKAELEKKESSLSSEFNPYSLSGGGVYYDAYETPEMADERQRQVQIGKQLDAIRKQLAGFEQKVSKAYLSMSESEKELNSKKAQVDGVLEKVKNYLTPDYLLDGLPEGRIKSVTDAEGKFSIKLPKGRYAFVASAQRRVFSLTEDYNWLIWVDVDDSIQKQVTLSNQNILGEDTEDAIFRLKDLVPRLGDTKTEAKSIGVGA